MKTLLVAWTRPAWTHSWSHGRDRMEALWPHGCDQHGCTFGHMDVTRSYGRTPGRMMQPGMDALFGRMDVTRHGRKLAGYTYDQAWMQTDYMT